MYSLALFSLQLSQSLGRRENTLWHFDHWPVWVNPSPERERQLLPVSLAGQRSTFPQLLARVARLARVLGLTIVRRARKTVNSVQLVGQESSKKEEKLDHRHMESDKKV